MTTTKLILVLTAVTFGILGAFQYMNSEDKPAIRGRLNLGIEELELRTALFRDWKIKYKKTYSKSEAHHRFLLWNKAYDYVQDHNSKGLSWTAGLNKFADLSDYEYFAIFNGADYNQENFDIEAPILDESKILKDINWMDEGAVTPLKDQGMCGSCYAFSAVGALEGIYAIKHKKLLNFSEQQIVDCSTNKKYGNAGCKSGFIPNSLRYTKENGIELLTDYPYKEEVKPCLFDASKVVFNNSGHLMVTKNNYTQLKAALSIQPIGVAISANSDAFRYYEKGVLSKNCSAKYYGHSVTLIGFKDNYWIVKNSWGDDWGMKGYMFLQIDDQNNGTGLCGVNRYPFYPTYEKPGPKVTEEAENYEEEEELYEEDRMIKITE